MGGPAAGGVDLYGDQEDIEGDIDGNAQYDQEDGDLADGESDDLLDDDLMDKISSSPSIDDGTFAVAVVSCRLELGLMMSRGYRLRIRLRAPQLCRDGRRASQCSKGRHNGASG